MNEIISSRFEYGNGGGVCTSVRNPSVSVKEFFKILELSPPHAHEKTGVIVFHHKECGMIPEMEAIFELLK